MQRAHMKPDRTQTVSNVIDRYGRWDAEGIAKALDLDPRIVKGWDAALKEGDPIHMPDGVYLALLRYLEVTPTPEQRAEQIRQVAEKTAKDAASMLAYLQSLQEPEEPAEIVKRQIEEKNT